MPNSSTYRPAFIFWLSVAQLISWGSVFYGFALLMEPVESALNLTRAESSLAFSLALLTEGLLAYPIGRLIDGGHERGVMAGGSMLTAFCLAAHSFVSNAAGFYLVWVGLGAALAATLYTPAFAVVTRRFPNDFRRAIITLTFLGGLASTVFIPLTSALISALGWRDSLWVLAALQLLVCLPIHVLQLRNAPRSIMQLRTHQVATPKPLGSHMRRPEFILIGTFMVLLAATTVALPAHLVSLLREYGLSEVWVIAIPASIGAMQVLGRAVLFFFERRIDIHSANRLIPCLIPVGLTLLLLLPLMNDLRVMLVIVFVVLYGIGNGMLTIVKGTAIAQYVDVSRVASLNGALGLPIALARAGAPLLLGVLWSEQHGYRYGLLLLLSFSLAGIACLIAAQAMVARKKAASAERA